MQAFINELLIQVGPDVDDDGVEAFLKEQFKRVGKFVSVERLHHYDGAARRFIAVFQSRIEAECFASGLHQKPFGECGVLFELPYVARKNIGANTTTPTNPK